MSSRRWIITVFSIFFISMSLLATVNYTVDPFGIFGSNISQNKYQINDRFVKASYIEEYHNEYNAYMFGSSRIGVVEPKLLEKYIPNTKFYNFTVSSANLHDYLLHLKYFISKKYEIKVLYLQLDIDNMNDYNQDSTDYLNQLHPRVSGDSVALFYARYLFGFFPLNIRKKIEVSLSNEIKKPYNMKTGVWRLPKYEKALTEDAKSYIENEKSFHFKNRRVVFYTKKEEDKKALKEMVELCSEQGIKLYVFTTPHNQNMMDTFVLEDYREYLKDISEVTSFYDFSGYNSVTTNNENYYEMSHYRPHVGEWVAARIFNDKNIEIPKDFGKLIERGSLHGN